MLNSRRVLPIVAIAVMALGLPLPSFASVGGISIQPVTPHAGESFDLVFGGFSAHQFGHEAPEVVIEGNVIQVIRDATLVGIPVPEESWAFEVEVGPLPSGQYRVQLFFRVTVTPSPFSVATETMPDLVLEAEKTLFIEPAVTLQVQPIGAVLPADYFLSGPRDLRFVVQLFAAGAGFEPIEVDVANRHVDVPVGRSQLLSPPPSLIEIDTIESVDLEPGEWTVRVIEDGRLLTTKTLDVLPHPVTLRQGRFEVHVDWLNQDTLSAGLPVGQPSSDSALFWFFQATNWELMLKVLDGCAINGHYWVFGAAQTDVGYRIRVHDTEADEIWEFENLAGTPSPAITDTAAFATCP